MALLVRDHAPDRDPAFQSPTGIRFWARCRRLNAADGIRAFAGYKQIPQYQILHHGMTLEEFKNIFFWEWLHRFWGRVIGLVFAVPLLVFWIQKRIDKKLGFKLLGIFALGGLQGFIGWFMVESGLEVRTSVSPYRLALHLGFALLVYALLLWTALSLTRLPRTRIESFHCLRRHGWIAGISRLSRLFGVRFRGRPACGRSLQHLAIDGWRGCPRRRFHDYAQIPECL